MTTSQSAALSILPRFTDVTVELRNCGLVLNSIVPYRLRSLEICHFPAGRGRSPASGRAKMAVWAVAITWKRVGWWLAGLLVVGAVALTYRLTRPPELVWWTSSAASHLVDAPVYLYPWIGSSRPLAMRAEPWAILFGCLLLFPACKPHSAFSSLARTGATGDRQFTCSIVSNKSGVSCR